jgi:hypothetical protein
MKRQRHTEGGYNSRRQTTAGVHGPDAALKRALKTADPNQLPHALRAAGLDYFEFAATNARLQALGVGR